MLIVLHGTRQADRDLRICGCERLKMLIKLKFYQVTFAEIEKNKTNRIPIMETVLENQKNLLTPDSGCMLKCGVLKLLSLTCTPFYGSQMDGWSIIVLEQWRDALIASQYVNKT